jgi:hypothetical protein
LCRAGKRKWRNNPKTQQQIPHPHVAWRYIVLLLCLFSVTLTR